MAEKPLKSLRFHGLDDIYKIPSTAEDVGATPVSHLNNSDNPHNVTASQIGAAVPSDVTNAKTMAINESKTYTDSQVKKAAPRNLLDNSDFRNPVNQRGKAGTITETGYFIDRWSLASGSVSLVQGQGLSVNGRIDERIEAAGLSGKTMTIAAYFTDGSAICGSGVVSFGVQYIGIAGAYDDAENRLYLQTYDTEEHLIFIVTGIGNKTIKAVALYEGEYTLETLPEYQPKGYAVEFAECSRYYHHIGNARMTGCVVNGLGLVVPITVPTKMRQDIIASAVTVGPAQIFNDNGVWDNVSFYIVDYDGGGTYRLVANLPVNTTIGHAYLVMGIDALSADL